MEKKPVPLGIEFFETVSNECYYVDKTNIIETISKFPTGTCLLFTRPRRFGKTLMLSMLQEFFEKDETDKSQYFKGKKIWNNKEVIENEFQKYPLIHINLKNVIGMDFETLIEKMKECMSKEYQRHAYILSSSTLNSEEKEYFQSIVAKDSTINDLSSSLLRLSEMLYKTTNKKVIILIDEYDSPVHYSFDYGFYDETIMFFKQYFGESLKTNQSLRLAVITGILQIAKESLFSGVNNLVTNSILSKNMDEGFGFTENEVKDMLEYYDYSERYDDVCSWYGGYKFGNSKIFNPLSVLSFIQNGGEDGTYWNNTGESKTLGKILSLERLNSLLPLLSDKKINTEIDIALSYKDLDDSFISVCSYLLASGYLSISDNYEEFYSLVIPNKEIKTVFRREIRSRYLRSDQIPLVYKLKKAFQDGDSSNLKDLMEKYLLSTFSSYEMNLEKNYQILLSTTLAVIFDDAYIKNEFNAGSGRADIVVIPKDNKDLGFVVEVKSLKTRTIESRLENSTENAIKQIKTQGYDQELKNLGIKNILLFGVSFYKNKVSIKCEKQS